MKWIVIERRSEITDKHRQWGRATVGRTLHAPDKLTALAMVGPELPDRKWEVVSQLEWDSLPQTLKDAVLAGKIDNPNPKFTPVPRVR